MRGEQAIYNLEIKKKSGLSINPDIHHSKVFSSGEIGDEPGLEMDWNGLGLGFWTEQGLIGPGEFGDELGVKLGEEAGATGRERASATTFSLPGMCTMEFVNSARYARCLCWRADQGGLVLNKA